MPMSRQGAGDAAARARAAAEPCSRRAPGWATVPRVAESQPSPLLPGFPRAALILTKAGTRLGRLREHKHIYLYFYRHVCV